MDRLATPDFIKRHDREQAYPYELYDAWAEAGLLRLPFPEAYGGLGGSVIDMAIIAEELSRTSADFYMAFASSTFCGLNILRKASEEQKRHWLPKLLSGDVRMAISISEPEAGSDVGAMRTTARRDGDDYVISGQKLWSSGAGASNAVINVYVKTDPKAPYRQGMSLFLVDNDHAGRGAAQARHAGPPLHRHLRDLLQRRAGAGGPAGRRREQGLGLPARRACRSSGCARPRAIAARAQAVVDLALQYAKDRKQFGRPIGSFQAIAHMLADMATEVEAARSLMWRAAWMVASGQDALREISMAKLLSSETYAKVANHGHADPGRLRLHHGIRHAAPLPRLPRPPRSRPAPRRSSAT